MNTNSKPKKVQYTFSKRYVFTVHGADPEDLQALGTWADDQKDLLLMVVARENGEQSMHPHLQGYLELEQSRRILSSLQEVLSNVHLEPAKGTREHNLNYVYAVDKPYEVGLIVLTRGRFEVPRRYVSDTADMIAGFKPRPWQREIIKMTENPSSSREVVWVYELEGNVGKSFLCTYLHVMTGAPILGGSSRDMMCALARIRELSNQDPPVILFDLTRVDLKRSKSKYLEMMHTIEKCKNGLFFSGKYESTMIHMKRAPVVVVFANAPPLVGDELSADRWKVRRVIGPRRKLEVVTQKEQENDRKLFKKGTYKRTQ